MCAREEAVGAANANVPPRGPARALLLLTRVGSAWRLEWRSHAGEESRPFVARADEGAYDLALLGLRGCEEVCGPSRRDAVLLSAGCEEPARPFLDAEDTAELARSSSSRTTPLLARAKSFGWVALCNDPCSRIL